MKSVGIGAGVLLLIMVLFFTGAAALSGSENTWTATIEDKERINDCSGDTCESYYLVFTDVGVFKNSDSIIYGKFNSSDVQGRLKIGETYTFTSVGWRVGVFSMYPNIIDVEFPQSMAVRPVLKDSVFGPSESPLVDLVKERIAEQPVVVAASSNDIRHTVWDDIAECESNGTWDIDTGNGYRGGLQWKTSTWLAVKPPAAPENPAHATRAQEIKAAQNLMEEPWGGYQHWPVCSRVVGVR